MGSPRPTLLILHLTFAVLVVALVGTLSATPAHSGQRRNPASVGRGPDAEPPAHRELVAALREASRCRSLAHWPGWRRRCEELTPPEQHAELYEDLLALAHGELPGGSRPPWRGYWMSPQRRCQGAIGSAMVDGVADALLGRRRAGRGLWHRRARRESAFARVERHCDVSVRGDARGRTWPAVGPQCSAAIPEPGAAVDSPALRRCLETLVTSWLGRVDPSRERPRPNIVVIMTDDQRHDTLGAIHSDGSAPVMPAVMERLASEGVLFANSFVTTPVCGPSRASAYTGQYVFRHGTRTNETGNHFDDSSTVATWLQDAGYRTAFLGKYINYYANTWRPLVDPPYVPPGWDEWKAFNVNQHVDHFDYTMVEDGEIVSYGPDPEDYSTDALARHAVDFIDRAAGDPEPFLLFVSTAAPHWPYESPTRHRGAFFDAPPWNPPSYFEEDVSDKPAWVQALSGWSPLTDFYAQLSTKLQKWMLPSIDELVDDVMDRLEAHGIADETAVIYTSDNGISWYEHRWWSKVCPWEECLRVPLVVRYPPLAPLARVESRKALNIDLAPTIADLAGVTPPPDRDGESLVRVLDHTQREWREEFFFECERGPVKSFTGLYGDQWKYVEYANGERELYDLAADPHELESLAADPAYAPLLAEFTQRLTQYRPREGTQTRGTVLSLH